MEANSAEILEKVETLKSVVMASVTGGIRDDEKYQSLRRQLLEIHWIKAALPRFIRTASDLSQIWHEITLKEERGLEGPGVYKRRRTFITEQFDPLINHLLGSGPEKVADAFFPKGSHHDAYVHIRSILAKAQKDLFIIDPYVDSTIYQLLGTLPTSSMVIRILTSKFPNDFALEKQKFIKQHSTFQVETRSARDFHDRFIFVDNAHCHLVGASIKDAGSSGCTLLAITDSSIVQFILAYANEVWDRAATI